MQESGQELAEMHFNVITMFPCVCCRSKSLVSFTPHIDVLAGFYWCGASPCGPLERQHMSGCVHTLSPQQHAPRRLSRMHFWLSGGHDLLLRKTRHCNHTCIGCSIVPKLGRVSRQVRSHIPYAACTSVTTGREKKPFSISR